MKKSLFYILVSMLLSFNVVAANVCQKYLGKSQSSFLDETSDNLIALQLEVYEQQQALVHDVHLSLQELSVPRRESGQMVKSATNVRSATLTLLGKWSSVAKDSPWRLNFMENLLEDPYLNSLSENWTDYRSDYLKGMVQFAISQNARIPRPVNGVYQLEDYLDIHLTSDGPMKLPPYLLMLRIMRDHDPNLNDPSRSFGYAQQTIFSILSKIDVILEYQKILYILNRDILKLKDFRFGSAKLWDQVGTLKEALSEFHYLKRNIRNLYSPYFSQAQYEAMITSQQLSASVTYEDHLVSQFVNHRTVEESDLAQRYRIIKNLIRLVTASQSLDELKEVMASQIGLEHFLY